MNLNVAVTPSGDLNIIADPQSLPTVSTETAERLIEEFGYSSAAGLVLLSSQDVVEELPPAIVFWRDFARQFMQALCLLGEDGFAQWKSVPAPPSVELENIVTDAPPMRGLEYLNADVFRKLWAELRSL